MAISQVATGVTILNSLNGLGCWSFTNWNASAVSAIAQGSVIEVAGAWFIAASDTSINASSLTAIATAASFYVYVQPSGTAGSQILTPYATTTAPVWTAKQGWYASAASTLRYVGGMTKDGTSSYSKKWLYEEKEVLSVKRFDDGTVDLGTIASALTVTGIVTAGGGVAAGTGNATLLKKVVNIGDWNMDSTTTVNVTHGLTASKIRSIHVIVRNDLDETYNLTSAVTSTVDGTWSLPSGGSVVTLVRTTGGGFDNTFFDSTSYNRGYVVIEYVP